LPAGLSSREAEVLALVAEGLGHGDRVAPPSEHADRRRSPEQRLPQARRPVPHGGGAEGHAPRPLPRSGDR
jgi:hypothetical protein